MTLTFLGSGSAFVRGSENYHSNILIDTGNETILFDCGTTINDALNHAEVDVEHIDNIIISHLHGDHSGGLEYVGFKRYFGTFPFGQSKPTIITTPGIMTKLWNNQLSASMDSLDEPASLGTYFKKNVLSDDNLSFTIDGYRFDLIETRHTNNKTFESHGLYLTNINKQISVFITGDTKFDPETLTQYYESADIIFQDCEFNEYPNGVHAQYHELITLDDHIKSKMWLYHYIVPDDIDSDGLDQMVVKDGFAGVVYRGHTITDSLD